MARLYGDENFDHPVVDELRRRGHDVLTALDAGQAGRGVADLDVLRFATGQSRAVLTFNRRHFIALHRQGAVSHAGIIVCTRDEDGVALAERIHHALLTVLTLDNTLLRVTRPPRP